MHFFKNRDKISGQIKKLGVLDLVSSLALALVGTIWAIYFEFIVKDVSKVGFINTIFGIAGVIAFIVFIPLLERNSKTKILGISFLIYAFSYFLFSFNDNLVFAVILGIVVYSAASVRINAMGIILRDKSKDGSVSKNTGLIYTLLNIAWLLGPVLAGFLSVRFGVRSVFLIAGILMFSAFLFLKFSGFKDNRKNEKVRGNIFGFVKNFFSKKKFILNYVVRGGISFWWAFIYIFIPIYIIESGRSSLIVGYFLAGVVAPLIFLEYPFGKIAGRKGFKKMFFRGYIILAIVSIFCFFIGDFYAILVLLILGSVGAAMLEPTTEAYFFDITTIYQRDKYYGIYNTSLDIFYALSLFVIAIALRFFEFKNSFLFMGIFMLIFALISLGAKEVIERKG